jgi:hypothetical protein
VAGGVKGNPDTVQVGVFAVGDGLNDGFIPEAQAKDLEAFSRG